MIAKQSYMEKINTSVIQLTWKEVSSLCAHEDNKHVKSFTIINTHENMMKKDTIMKSINRNILRFFFG